MQIIFLMDTSLFNQLHTQLDEYKARVESWEGKEAQAKQNYEAAIRLADQNAEAVQSKVIFDVGGTLFSTTKETLLRVKDSYFTSLMQSGRWKPQADGTYFIDRSPIWFGRVMDYMRYDKLNTTGLSEVEKGMLFSDFDYFFPNDHPGVPKDHWLVKYAKILQGWLGKPLEVSKCLFKASVDGATPKAFHGRCDNKCSTLTVVKTTKGWIFGGYNPTSWQSQGEQTTAKEAFVFTLKNPHGIPPARYLCKPNHYSRAVYNNAGYGPTFAGGWTTLHSSGPDIYFPNSYEDTTGLGKATFIGDEDGKFDIKEVEVYAL